MATFWHVDCVRTASLNVFTERYRKWCGRHHYNFAARKAEEIYLSAKEQIALVPKSPTTKLLIQEAAAQVKNVSHTTELLRAEMNRLASQLPEYPVVMSMYGVGESLGPQLIAEIGDVTRFAHKRALAAFAGVDPAPNQSGTRDVRSNRSTKRGSPYLRQTLFKIMMVLLQNAPPDDPVYQYLDRLRAKGKPYYVYMTAGANKFLVSITAKRTSICAIWKTQELCLLDRELYHLYAENILRQKAGLFDVFRQVDRIPFAALPHKEAFL